MRIERSRRRGRGPARQRAVALVVSLLLVACESVPDLHFVDDLDGGDASPTDGSTSGDSGDGGGGVTDGATESATDAGTDAPECAGPAPTDARCCAGHWCVNCDDAKCLACPLENCKADQLCCGKNQKVQCKAQCP